MVTDQYGTLLAELSSILKIPLKPDKHNTCLIHFEKEHLHVQIEIDSSKDFIIIGTNIAEVPPGRYRQDVFKQALQANYIDKPRGGILAFSKHANKLVLFLKLPLKDLHGGLIAAALPDFLRKASRWKDEIEKNQLPPLSGETSTQTTGNRMFGLA